MAKSRAQRKAEAARKRRLAEQGIEEERDEESHAQHDTQVPESADVLEAELAIEHGAEETPDEALEAPAPAEVRTAASSGGSARRPSAAPRSRPRVAPPRSRPPSASAARS